MINELDSEKSQSVVDDDDNDVTEFPRLHLSQADRRAQEREREREDSTRRAAFTHLGRVSRIFAAAADTKDDYRLPFTKVPEDISQLPRSE